jgi:hypothetical protein
MMDKPGAEQSNLLGRVLLCYGAVGNLIVSVLVVCLIGCGVLSLEFSM